MTDNGKKLSNPFSTGSGGARFEANVQATFVTLMLSGGYAPCLPAWPIVEIKQQGAVAGYETDDLIVFVENPTTHDRRRLLGQVKNSIVVSEKNKLFSEVIQAAWNDFNNPESFAKGKDVIALITGPISALDTDGVNGLLEQARHTRDANEFLTQVERSNFCSNNVRKKLTAFKTNLKSANGGTDVPNRDLHEFLKHFHLLGYDLAKKGSVHSSLLQSHISQFNRDIPDKIWYQIVNEVQDFNQYAGTVTLDTLPYELVEHFKEPIVTYIPRSLVEEEAPSEIADEVSDSDWSKHSSAQKLALANIIGSWDEKCGADIAIVTQIIGEDYHSWISDLQEALQLRNCPISYKNGVWKFHNRLISWQVLGSRIFDHHLDTLKATALEVLQIDDPALELPAEERYASSLHGKVQPHSDSLRSGLAESLALVGSQAIYLNNCTKNKADAIAVLSVRELLEGCDWVRWGSLSSLLPIISEASPAEFLNAVENSIAITPSPFDHLFEQERAGMFGANYMTGLLWALEGIAWEEVYLSRTAVVLAEIAARDPGGNWANRPSNSLTDIFLPWLPHTLASVEKRQAALKIITAEQPAVAWKLLESLLPGNHGTTMGTHKPILRDIIPDDWEKGVTKGEYWEVTHFCADLIVEQAGTDAAKLSSLIRNYDHLPSSAADSLREKLLFDATLELSEQDRMHIWSELRKFVTRHRRFSKAKWSLDDDSLNPLEEIANRLAPTNPKLLYKSLFSEADINLYEGDGGWQEQTEYLFKKRKAAVGEIFDQEGLPEVLKFAMSVSNAHLVGEVLADFDSHEFDAELLPGLLDKPDRKSQSIVSSYAWHRKYKGNWEWFDDIDKSDWSADQIASLLCALPFEEEAWERVEKLLGVNEILYWKNTTANAYQSESDMYEAYVKLLAFDRPAAVIEGLGRDLFEKKELNTNLACEALLKLVQHDQAAETIDSYTITRIIEALQQNPATDQNKLFSVEWAYVSLLDRNGDGAPVTLENKLASDPSFFCELIQLVYRSDAEETETESSEESRNIANNAYLLLSIWRVVPGAKANGDFDPDLFSNWLDYMEESVTASGHHHVAMTHLGGVLVNAPEGPDGQWIHPVIAESMNKRERSRLRDSYGTGVYNSRGIHTVDSEGKPEREFAEKYRRQADEVENAGYHRLATTLRDLASNYDREADRIISVVK